MLLPRFQSRTYTKLFFKDRYINKAIGKSPTHLPCRRSTNLSCLCEGTPPPLFVWEWIQLQGPQLHHHRFFFAVLHIGHGNTEKPLKRLVRPSRSSCLRRSPSALPLMLRVWSRAERHGLPGLAAPSDLICSGGTFMWFTPAAPPPAALQAPPRSGSRGSRWTRHRPTCGSGRGREEPWQISTQQAATSHGTLDCTA